MMLLCPADGCGPFCPLAFANLPGKGKAFARRRKMRQRFAAMVSPLSRMRITRELALLFTVMLVIGAGNTALTSIMPTIGRSLKISDSLIAIAFSMSGAIWVVSAPFWAGKSGQWGHKAMVLTGILGFAVSMLCCGAVLFAGLHGMIVPVVTIVAFMAARSIYGTLGSAAPPAAQAMLVAQTSREERTKVLTLLASAFGLGTIIGPAVAPLLRLPGVGFAGPAFCFAGGALVLAIILWRHLPGGIGAGVSGAAQAYPTVGNEPTGASVRVATSPPSATRIGYTDPRIWPWMLAGLVIGHAQAMTGQAVGFLVIDRLQLPLDQSQEMIGLVQMSGAFAALLVQWGLIPALDLTPRAMLLVGLSMAGIGVALVGGASSLTAIATAFALSSAGFGFARPGYTAGSSLAVGSELQNAVAGKVTSVNGAAFVLGPSIGVGMYEFWGPLPYTVSAIMCLALGFYVMRRIKPSDPGASASPEQ